MKTFEGFKPVAGAFFRNMEYLGVLSAEARGENVVSENGVTRWEETEGETLRAFCTLTTDANDRTARLEVELKNSGSEDSRELDLNTFFLILNDRAGRYRGFRASGGLADEHYPPENFRTQEVRIHGSLVNCSPAGGRSSDRNLPMTMVADENGAGFWFGLEWSGTWQHVLQTPRHGNATRLQSFGLRIYARIGARLSLKPGESLKLPAVVFGFFDNGFDEGSNRLRRYLRDRVCPTLEGRSVLPPLSYDHWFGVQDEYDDAFLRRQADRAAELGLEYFVLDSGWFAGGWGHGVGNWDCVDAKKFPHGLKPYADYVRSKGLKPGLWLEPERALRGTSWPEKHPEFYIDIGTVNLHLNLARRDVQDFVIGFVSGLIGELGLCWTRWDYNIDPALYWRKADPTGRIQLDYVAGLYRVLDTLMARHPGWLLENCASGGRRIDLGMLRRSHTCWFSDETVSPEICRFMQLQANCFLPGRLCNSGVVAFRDAGDAETDAYDAISHAAGALSFDGDIAAWSPALTGRMAQCVREYKTVRHLLDADYHRLLRTPCDLLDWDAGLFVSEDRNEALLFVFRVEGESGQTIVCRGLKPGPYRLTPLFGADGGSFILTGEELTSNGLPVQLGPEEGKAWHLRHETILS